MTCTRRHLSAGVNFISQCSVHVPAPECSFLAKRVSCNAFCIIHASVAFPSSCIFCESVYRVSLRPQLKLAASTILHMPFAAVTSYHLPVYCALIVTCNAHERACAGDFAHAQRLTPNISCQRDLSSQMSLKIWPLALSEMSCDA